MGKKTSISRIGIFLALVPATMLAFGCSSINAQTGDIKWHTPPDKWDKPRTFEQDFDLKYESQLTIQRTQRQPEMNVRVLSPNEAYWFGVASDWPEHPDVTDHGTVFEVKSDDASIYVFAERPWLTQVTLKHHYPNFVIKAQWITERLLHVRTWWGRVLGSSYIIDVESEKVVYKEMIFDGAPAFMQWRHSEKD